MLLQQSIEQVSIIYTYNTYFVVHWSIYLGVSGQCPHTITHCFHDVIVFILLQTNFSTDIKESACWLECPSVQMSCNCSSS